MNAMRNVLFLLLFLLTSMIWAGNGREMTITAHAGAYNTPDNTMESVQTALALRTDLIEIDVRCRPNGTLAIGHDALQADEEGTELWQVLEAVARTQVNINLDIKQMEALPELYKLLRKYKLTKRVYMTGVPDAAWERAQKECPRIPYFTDLAPDTLRLGDTEYCRWMLERLKLTGSMGINCHYGNANATLARLLHENGMLLSVWTVNEPRDIARMLSIGPDNITTRRPDRVEQIANLHRIGKGRSFCFMQLADPQLGFNADGSSSLAPAVKQLERAVDIVNRQKPAFLICTGDFVHELLNDTGAQKYREVMSRLNRRTKLLAVPGNHDIRELSPEYFDFYKRNYGADRFAYRYKGCAFIGFNSSIVQAGPSELEQEQYVWLERELQRASKCRAIFLFAHIPLICNSLDEADDYHNFPKSLRMKYVQLFRRYGAKTMLCGHLHRNLQTQADGIQVFVASATGYPFDGREGMPLIEVGRDCFDYRFITLDEYETRR